MSQERRALDATAIAAMLLLTALWGFQQVTIKWIAADVSHVMQAALRSIMATVLLLFWARAHRIALFGRDGTLAAGIGAGLLFAFEFVLIYGGLAYTNASRMSVFVYLAPPLTAATSSVKLATRNFQVLASTATPSVPPPGSPPTRSVRTSM